MLKFIGIWMDFWPVGQKIWKYFGNKNGNKLHLFTFISKRIPLLFT